MSTREGEEGVRTVTGRRRTSARRTRRNVFARAGSIPTRSNSTCSSVHFRILIRSLFLTCAKKSFGRFVFSKTCGRGTTITLGTRTHSTSTATLCFHRDRDGRGLPDGHLHSGKRLLWLASPLWQKSPSRVESQPACDTCGLAGLVLCSRGVSRLPDWLRRSTLSLLVGQFLRRPFLVLQK